MANYCPTLASPAMLATLVLAEPAQAHGLGVRYDLPVPLWLYLGGAGLTVALSFAIVALFARTASPRRDHARLFLMRCPGRLASAVLLAGRVGGVGIYLILLYAGLFGAQSPLKNIAPVAIWAVWWVGMAYVSALLGNLWTAVDPLDSLFVAAEAVYARLCPGRRLSLGLRYPETLGIWPAVALLLVFIWMEMVWEQSDHPAPLATAMLAYSVLTWLGMLLFGRPQWRSHGEVFSIVFGLLAGFAPTELRVSTTGDRELHLRAYAVGLLPHEPVGTSRVALVLTLLAAVSFDGFMETPLWAALVAGHHAGVWLPTAGIIGAPLLFLAAYLVCCRLIAWGGGAAVSTRRLAGLFVLTLVPIAIAYHLAHYLSFLAAATQYLGPLVSDPFGFGWDLFGTKNVFVRTGVVDARAVWYVSVVAIIIGHVAAVYLAHRIALQEFPDRHAALRSQWSMLALMVAYTMTSLWIISQPIVTRRFG